MTLRPAFEGQDRQEILRQIAHEEPAPPRKLNPAIPRELETILLKAMGKEPESRYATAQELADDLRRFLEHKPIKAKRPSAYEQFRSGEAPPLDTDRHRGRLDDHSHHPGRRLRHHLREQVATRAAMKRARNEQERALRFAAAQANSERAVYRLSVVLQGLQHLLFRLQDRTLPDVPQVRELRRSVQEETRRTIEGFIDASSRDPRVLSESIIGCQHLAQICFLSGEVKDAIKAFEQAIHLGDRLVTLDPSEPEHATARGNCHNTLGLRLYASGLRSQAINHFEQARRIYRRASSSIRSVSRVSPPALVLGDLSRGLFSRS